MFSAVILKYTTYLLNKTDDEKLERNMTIIAYILVIGGTVAGYSFAEDGSTFLSIISFIAVGFGSFWLWAIS